MAEGHADGKAGLPVIQVNCLRSGFDSGDLKSIAAKAIDDGNRVPVVLPRDSVFGAERGLGDGLLRRMGRDPAEA